MSSIGHVALAIKHGLDHTSVGKQVVGATTVGAAITAKAVAGPAVAAAIVAAVPIAIAGGLAYLVGEATKYPSIVTYDLHA